MHHRAFLGTLTIANGGTDSNVLSAKELKMARAIVFENAESALTGTVSVLAAADEGAAIGDCLPVSVDGTDVTVSAGAIEQWNISPGCSIAIQSSSAEGAERTVNVYAILDMI